MLVKHQASISFFSIQHEKLLSSSFYCGSIVSMTPAIRMNTKQYYFLWLRMHAGIPIFMRGKNLHRFAHSRACSKRTIIFDVNVSHQKGASGRRLDNGAPFMDHGGP
jgi:hypothetical protein